MKNYPEISFVMAFCNASYEDQCHYGYVVTSYVKTINKTDYHLTYVMKITSNGNNLHYDYHQAVWYRDMYTGSDVTEIIDSQITEEKELNILDKLKEMYTTNEMVFHMLSLIPVNTKNITKSMQDSIEKAKNKVE